MKFASFTLAMPLASGFERGMPPQAFRSPTDKPHAHGRGKSMAMALVRSRMMRHRAADVRDADRPSVLRNALKRERRAWRATGRKA